VDLAVQNAQLASLRQVEVEIAQEFDRIPQLQQAYTELQRQNAVESQLVNTFLSRLQELRITEAQEISPWRVLQPAGIPKIPISPNRQRNLVLGLFAGGLLGVGTALLLERLDQRIKGVEEAKAFTGLAMLGAVPKVALEGLAMGEEQRQNYKQMPFTEAFRSTALNLGYLGSSEEMRTLCFTSALSGEGKSTVTFHLAKALAELGHKVLLVDADMRKPTQHKMIQETNAVGLSTALVGETTWQNALHSVITDRFHLLSSGPMPPNPVALLGSPTMSRLLGEWRQAYRYVLVDTPPIVGIADAQSMANQMDGVVLVLGLERASRPSVARALELLRSGQDRLVGMMINLLDARHDGYAYYQYYYSEAEKKEKVGTGNPSRQTGRPRRRR
jgi:succinoglycan biosynthesis transport protein ExoP